MPKLESAVTEDQSASLPNEEGDGSGWKPEDLKMFRFLREFLNHVNITYISTYPPQECGIATFTRDLQSAIAKYTPFSDPSIIAVSGEASIEAYPKIVKFRVQKQNLQSYIEAASFVNDSGANAVSLQHEYGIFGGEDGEYILEFLKRLKVPIIATLHTVLFNPSPNQRRIVQEIAGMSGALVVMVQMGKEMLMNSYGVPAEKVVVIRHGVPNVHRIRPSVVKKTLNVPDHTVISTFGLISRGKGIEYAIQAMPEVVKKKPKALYLVLGETHPGVRNYEGESYRKELLQLVSDLGMEEHVRFNNRFLSLDELISYLCATDVYVTPYINRDQICSGTLAYALGCGKAIISTPYLYSEEVLSKGRGILVDFKNPGEIAQQIIYILENPAVREQMETRAYRYGRRSAWFNVAIDYLDLIHRLTPKSKTAVSVSDTETVEQQQGRRS
jgi:glycosyltransferase involved in cell wall biosynthesis